MTTNNRKAPREFWLVKNCSGRLIVCDKDQGLPQDIHVREIDPTEPTEIERLNRLMDEALIAFKTVYSPSLEVVECIQKIKAARGGT